MITGYTFLTSVLIVLLVVAIVYRKVRVPAQEISRRMCAFVAGREKQTHEEKLPVRRTVMQIPCRRSWTT